MEVYVVCEVVDEEYGGFEIIFITANEERAKEYCEKNNSKWEHWSGHTIGNGHAGPVAQFYVVDVVVALVGDVAVVHQIGIVAVNGVEPHRK